MKFTTMKTKPIEKKPPLEGDLGRSLSRKEIDALIKEGKIKEPHFNPATKRLRDWDRYKKPDGNKETP